ncbi:ABC transporter ATP-binding protein [Aeromicrobium wangtongii]|uniref:ABC transporter ATP-binding protein n=1 Tax=Aeromicrobium wangtongii TaxID=2969247 RepID=A0ABY5M7X4_9ACTN|nr:ABC transporter ATP-binding protein [Aeromicrobium wangtongii]MCD9199946.1 ABC transporter ATP-binding protein [Aeromicrobium wangtongii]MCL3816934.1 ABC transporter ATP-binding protein [Aeromicrobium wangtongii]UUP13562.1 ABC transporter ATP-binding protein [Aeromicrobium wangtongii]
MTESSLASTATPDRDVPPLLSVSGVRKTYAGTGGGASTVAIDDLTFTVDKGEFVVIVGPSGCGKTTLLRCLSGLLAPTSGTVEFDGRTVAGVQAGLGVVFQEYTRSLMPWLSVRANVELGLHRLPKAERREQAERSLRHVGLVEFGDRYPWQLSGGMQQRVAIARAISADPRLLMMDEPFASVDAQTRTSLESMVLDLWVEAGWTGLLVTHDIDEAIFMADRVLVLSQRPSRVIEAIDIVLDRPRDQLETRASPEFQEYRRRITALIGQH